MATQQELALQMLQQLRLLDPAMSGEVGTPERKIIDTVAQALSENQIDYNVVSGAFDIDAKFGSDLDKFLAIFGFGRQQARAATGFVKFSRTTASVYDIVIARNTQVVAPSVVLDGGATTVSLSFLTTEPVTLPAGSLSVTVPVRCATSGAVGNVAAGQIIQFGSTPILGITDVTNDIATEGGVNQESDDEYKIRFKNTVFRNLAGTEDQFLALAVSTQNTTKANVVGPISRYREYIQVPDVDDASADPDSGTSGNGSAGEYTTALSTIPYSKHTYTDVPYFVSTGSAGPDNVFYRQDIEFSINNTDASKDKGDTYRGRINATGPNVLTDATTAYQPNLTFTNVYTGTDSNVLSVSPGDILLFEHSYMSAASRNNWSRQILNCVDVFVNGNNEITADAVIPRPSGTQNLFVANSAEKLYVENFRRVDQPERRPVVGNLFTPMYWQPAVDLPDSIVTSDATYIKNVHYWAVEDITELGNTVRARNGIEWATGIKGKVQADYDTGPFTGPKIIGTADDAISIDGYTYDRNVIDLQAALEGNKQVTTDVLAHRAKTRFFKFDVTVMYQASIQAADIDAAIQSSVQTLLDGQYFGTVIQLSDVLQAIHNTSGVDNVRWSRDLTSARDCVIECDINGEPLLNVMIDHRVMGDASTTAVQQVYLVGSPTGGTYTITLDNYTTAPIAYNANTATFSTALSNAGISVGGVTGSGTPTDPFVVTFLSAGSQSLMTANASGLTGGSSVFNSDFYLQDDELPSLPTSAASGDSVAGLIIRPRAQNVWNQL